MNKDINYNFDNNIPIYLQIAEFLRIQIISGKLKTGEKIPSVRELALNMKVNPNTIVKSLSYLEDEKLIYTESTNGKYVTLDNNLILKIKNNLARDKIKIFLLDMESLGIEFTEVLKYLENMKGK